MFSRFFCGERLAVKNGYSSAMISRFRPVAPIRHWLAGLGVVAMLLPAAAVSASADSPAKNPHARLEARWFFSFGYGRNRADVDKIKSLVDTAAARGLNGMVLSTFGLDSVTSWKADDFALLKEVADHCKARNIELIPSGFSVGYGGGALNHDRSFAAALPARLRLKAENRRIVPASGANLLKNGGLEDHKGDRFAGFDFIDGPGKVSFADTRAAEGKTAVRFENFTANPHGHGRLMQTVAVRPRQAYRFSFRVKTRDLDPANEIKALIMAGDQYLADTRPKLDPTSDWTRVALDFVNTTHKEVRIYAGIWGGKSGVFWLDDLRFAESAELSDIPRRAGTPVTLRSLDRDATFAEGMDFAPIRCQRKLDSIAIPEGSAIRDGENLELSCYKIPGVSHTWGKQVSLCMSNPDLYTYWEAQARRLHEVLPFKRFLLSMDEIRNGGGCLACRKRGISMAEILGDCFKRQRAIFKRIDPEIEVMTWSDMLDPAHNARDHYYGVVGDFTGSWKHAPKDLTIVCWYHKIRDTSLGFFSSHGFRTMGACYYDAPDLGGSREWLESLRATPNAEGIMYTSWAKKYDLLGAFGDMLSEDALDACVSTLEGEKRKGAQFLLRHMPARDRERLDPALFRENLDEAYIVRTTYPWAKALPEDLFFNDVLPYAVVTENRDSWRPRLRAMFAPLLKDAKSLREAAEIVGANIGRLAGVKYDKNREKACQSPGESMSQGMATCTGLSILMVDALRASGVPARLAAIPMWGTMDGNHTWVEVHDGKGWQKSDFGGLPKQWNKGWSVARCAYCDPELPIFGVFASSYCRTPIDFPTVWEWRFDKLGGRRIRAADLFEERRDNRGRLVSLKWPLQEATSSGIDRTAHYIEMAGGRKIPIPKGAACVVVEAHASETKTRLAVPIRILDEKGRLLYRGVTASPEQDLNDYVRLLCKPGKLRVEHQSPDGKWSAREVRAKPNKETRIDIGIDDSGKA